MSDNKLFAVSDQWAKKAWIDKTKYERLYQQSIEDPEGFWREQGKRIDWIKPYGKIKDSSFDRQDVHVRWFYDGSLNVSVNCLDRHLKKRGDQVAIIWEGDDPKTDRKITYRQLHAEVCKFANVLKACGVKKGDPPPPHFFPFSP